MDSSCFTLSGGIGAENDADEANGGGYEQEREADLNDSKGLLSVGMLLTNYAESATSNKSVSYLKKQVP